MYSIMGNYGITNKLNVMFGLPYVKTKASAGQLKGMKGIQDLSFWVKWKGYSKKMGQGRLSLFAIGGYSLPASDYTADFLPMSIGLESKNLSLRGMADYQRGKWFITASGTYVRRSNIEIDRTAYYTTEMHYTNEVKMPDAASYNVRVGYRDKGGYAELIVDGWKTLGGFDITRNNMPFASNEMNATRVGFNFKYPMPFMPQLSVTGNVMTTVAGRNVGQSSGFNAGIFYVIDFSKKEKTASDKSKK
jgi:Putative MetA-pathway of phenol degradation